MNSNSYAYFGVPIMVDIISKEAEYLTTNVENNSLEKQLKQEKPVVVSHMKTEEIDKKQ